MLEVQPDVQQFTWQNAQQWKLSLELRKRALELEGLWSSRYQSMPREAPYLIAFVHHFTGAQTVGKKHHHTLPLLSTFLAARILEGIFNVRW